MARARGELFEYLGIVVFRWTMVLCESGRVGIVGWVVGIVGLLGGRKWIGGGLDVGEEEGRCAKGMRVETCVHFEGREE